MGPIFVLLLKNRKWSRLLYQISQNFSLNFDFRAHISTFRDENILKNVPFKAKNNAVTTSEQPQNNLQKVKKTTFFEPKMSKINKTKS